LSLYYLNINNEFIDHAKATTSGVQHPRTSWPALREFALHLPPLADQQKIASVLGLVQRAIEQQERLIALTTELKKALLHKLFTEGLHGEPQKQTEIGPVPESWEIVKLGAVLSEDPKNGIYKHSSAYGSGTPILRINDFSNDGDVVTSAPNRVIADASEWSLYALRKDDIVTNRVNSLSHLGKSALIGELAEPMVFESNMMRFRVDELRANSLYIFRLLNSSICKKQIIGSAKRAVAQSSINQGNLKAILLPLPPIAIQEEISAILETVVNKARLLDIKRQSLGDLFRTLLHQLMTAQIRVNRPDLSGLEMSL
jgi:type I restriction enzyme S subunit